MDLSNYFYNSVRALILRSYIAICIQELSHCQVCPSLRHKVVYIYDSIFIFLVYVFELLQQHSLSTVCPTS